MFIYMHYAGPEPKWAESLRGMVPAFSPAFPFSAQKESLFEHLEGKSPAARAGQYREAFQLDDSVWKPLSEVADDLIAADSLASTDALVWRDQWLLSRADVVIMDSMATADIPILAALWSIPVVAVSFSPVGMNPWLAKASQITVNSPTSAEQILAAVGIRQAPAEGEKADGPPGSTGEVALVE